MKMAVTVPGHRALHPMHSREGQWPDVPGGFYETLQQIKGTVSTTERPGRTTCTSAEATKKRACELEVVEGTELS